MSKLKIFLGDLEHTWEKINIWTFPLNVAYVAAYAQKAFPDLLDVRLFKRPEEMTEAIRRESPDIVAATYYVWNSNLANHVLGVAKTHDPRTLTVGGGPHFTNINADEPTAVKFFSGMGSNCDAFVVNQGELGFVELLRAYLACGRDLGALRTTTVPGCITNGLGETQSVSVGALLDGLADLDDIPSPYLSGLLDPFFDGPFAPVLETNRSCPYRCTFCAWGIGTQKLSRYSDERLFDEMDYISRRCTNTGILYIADANYGVLERDEQISAHLYKCSVEHGYPKNVIASWNKTRPDRVLNAARELRGLGRIGASMQSLHAPTLEAIKRKNLSLEVITEMIKELDQGGMSLFSELIIGLPEETRDSHLDAIRQLMDLGAEIFNYNLHLLPGTELETAASRERYVTRTGWRLYDGGYGIYDGERIFEGEEVVLATPTLPIDELRSFRFIHFLIQLMWSKEWYRDFLALFRQHGIHPLDVVVGTAQACDTDAGPIGEIARRFREDHALELFESFGDLQAFWSRDDSFQRLREGDYGKLNYVYTQVILVDHHEDFDRFLLGVARELAADVHGGDETRFLHQCHEILRYGSARKVNLASPGPIVASRRERFDFDILSWKEAHHETPLESRPGASFEYEFYLPDSEVDFLQTQRNQFRSHSVNMTMRKVSEGIAPDRLLYRVRRVRPDTVTDSAADRLRARGASVTSG